MSENKEPIRILNVVGRMDRGGIETLIMNIYRNIDREKVQFDFLCHYGREAAYNDEIRAMGGRIYEMPALRDETHFYYWKVFEYIRALKQFFREHKEYKIVHGHMTNTASIYMPIAKKEGVTTLISHSHNSHSRKGLSGMVTNILQKPVYKTATDWFACSKVAGEFFYPKGSMESGKVTVIANAVDAERFRYNPQTRERMRKTLGVEDKVVIGIVARLRPEKNHVFLVDVLKEALKTEPNAVLLCAGDGPELEAITQKAKALGVEDKVIMLGMRDDVPDVLQAMDVFTLASLWEGLPVTGIEAQAAGLQCVVTDGVTDEVNALGMVEFLSLNDPLDKWASALLNAAKEERKDTYEELKAAGYDIHTTAPWLQNFYEERGK